MIKHAKTVASVKGSRGLGPYEDAATAPIGKREPKLCMRAASAGQKDKNEVRFRDRGHLCCGNFGLALRWLRGNASVRRPVISARMPQSAEHGCGTTDTFGICYAACNIEGQAFSSSCFLRSAARRPGPGSPSVQCLRQRPMYLSPAPKTTCSPCFVMPPFPSKRALCVAFLPHQQMVLTSSMVSA